jgi:hypothetical protein
VPKPDVSGCSKLGVPIALKSAPIGSGRASRGWALTGGHSLDGHCNLNRSFRKALTSSWDLFAAAS